MAVGPLELGRYPFFFTVFLLLFFVAVVAVVGFFALFMGTSEWSSVCV